MGIIQPHKNNCRYCEKCRAGYVINGDESQYWCQAPGFLKGDEFYLQAPTEGLCEFCKPEFTKFCHALEKGYCNCGKPSRFDGLMCGINTASIV